MSLVLNAIIAVVIITLIVIAFEKLGIMTTLGVLLILGAFFFFVGVIYWWASNNV